MTKKYSLSDMILDECSFVDKGANPGAKIVFWKRDSEAAAVDPTRQDVMNMTLNVDASRFTKAVQDAIAAAKNSEAVEKAKGIVGSAVEKTRKFFSTNNAFVHDLEDQRIARAISTLAKREESIAKLASTIADLHKSCCDVATACPTSIQPAVASTFDELLERQEVQERADDFRRMVYALQDSMNSIANDPELRDDVRRDLLVRSLNEFKAAVEDELSEQPEEDYMAKAAMQAAIAKSRLALFKHGDHDQSDHGNWAEGSGGGGGAGNFRAVEEFSHLGRKVVVVTSGKAGEKPFSWSAFSGGREFAANSGFSSAFAAARNARLILDEKLK